MGAYTFLNGKKIQFWKVDVATEDEIVVENLSFIRNGTVLVSDVRDGIFIKTKEGILKVLEIQGENARRMTIQEYLRGNSIEEFDVFEQLPKSCHSNLEPMPKNWHSNPEPMPIIFKIKS